MGLGELGWDALRQEHRAAVQYACPTAAHGYYYRLRVGGVSVKRCDSKKGAYLAAAFLVARFLLTRPLATSLATLILSLSAA